MRIKRLKTPCDRFDIHYAEDKKFDVVGFGTNSVDHLCIVPEYPRLDSKTEVLQYAKLAGGQVATALVFLSRVGLRTKYVGKVGTDEHGRFSMDSFKSDSVDTTSVVVAQDAGNQFAVIIIEKGTGERTVLSQRGPGLNIPTSELKREDICAGRILHLDGYDVEGSISAAAWCREEGIPVSIDLDKAFPNCDKLIENIDFLITSRNFPVEFTGIADPLKAFAEMRKCYNGFLAVTLGPEGAMAWVGNECVRFPGFEIEAVDTTGAGDIFHGGFLYGLLQNWPLDRIIRFANAAAGLSCKYLGARSGIRPLTEILELSRSRSEN